MCCLLVAVVIIVLLALHYKYAEVDLTLKYYELFGKKVEELRGQVVWITGKKFLNLKAHAISHKRFNYIQYLMLVLRVSVK
jgi:hypothetical protein